MTKMKTYRCKHAVEALRWTDTAENREAFSAWFEKHGAVFETRGPIALLPDLITRAGSDTDRVDPGEWIIYTDDGFIALEDELFRRDYEEVA